MLRVFLNPGHALDGNPDPGASNRITGLRECDVAKNIADLVEKYLVAAGVEVVGNLQSDSLYEVVFLPCVVDGALWFIGKALDNMVARQGG